MIRWTGVGDWSNKKINLETLVNKKFCGVCLILALFLLLIYLVISCHQDLSMWFEIEDFIL